MILRKYRKQLRLPIDYVTSLFLASKNRDAFDDVRAYCMFIGYPHSGHSLIGSLLDAHPNVVISHEQDALGYIFARFSRYQIYSLLLRNSDRFTGAGRKWHKYDYAVSNQWQGRFERLLVIGDKQGEGSSLRLKACPWLLDRMRKTVQVDIRIIHVCRNPFDQITTMTQRRKKRFQGDLSKAIDHFVGLCEVVAETKKRLDRDELFDLKHERFVADPGGCLAEICQFMNLEAPGDYLDACSSIVFGSPRKRRQNVDWSHELKDRVHEIIDRHEFLHGYSFDD